MAFGAVFTASLVVGAAARLDDAGAVDGGFAGAADEGIAVDEATDPGTAPGFVSTTTGGARRGDVVTPGATSSATAPESPGAVSRKTWPTRITLTFSMLFHAASSR